MSVGYALDKASIDNRAASIVLGVRTNLQLAADLCALFNNTNIFANNAAFLAFSWTQPEIDFLRNSMTDLGGSSGSSLFRISHGLATLGGTNDFFFNGQHLTGVL
jgi:hypothetical protein